MVMKISLRLSESLLSIYESAGQELDENIDLEFEGPLSVRQIIESAGINPMLTPLISVGGVTCGLGSVIRHDAEITLIGPLAGG